MRNYDVPLCSEAKLNCIRMGQAGCGLLKYRPDLPRVLFASIALLIGIASVQTAAYAGPLASNDPPMATYGKSGAGLTPVTAADGGSCTTTGGSRTGAMAFTSSGKLLICESGRWRRYAVWNNQAVASGGACTNTTGVGSFARGTDGRLYVCR